MGKFKGSKSAAKTADDENDDALQKVLSNGYTSENERALPGRPGRRRMGPMGKIFHSVVFSRKSLSIYILINLLVSLT